MMWIDILKANQVQVLEQSELEAQQYWDYYIGLALGITNPFKGNIKRQTNINDSGLVDEFRVFTWIDTQTKLPLLSRTVGFSNDRFEGKAVIYFAGSIGLKRLLNTWQNQGPYRMVWEPKNPESVKGWFKREQTTGDLRVPGQQVSGKTKAKADEERNWLKDAQKPIKGKRHKDIPEKDKYTLEVLRAGGYYHSPERIDIGTIADKHSGNNLNRVSPLYRRSQNYLLDKFKGNWVVTVLINTNLREYYQTSKGGNFRRANFFTRSRSKSLVPPNIREIIRNATGRKSAPWFIHTPTDIDTSMAGDSFGTDSMMENRGGDFEEDDFDSHGRYKGKTGYQKKKDLDEANKAETIEPDDDETPGPGFKLLPTIRESGALRGSEIVNVKDEEHCCSVMRKKIHADFNKTTGTGRNQFGFARPAHPLVYMIHTENGEERKEGYNTKSSWRVRQPESARLTTGNTNFLIKLFHATSPDNQIECNELRELLEKGGSISEIDYVHAPDNLDGSERNENIRDLKRLGIDIDQYLKDWDECSQTIQDKFEHYDSDFTASTKVDRWFGMIKEGGSVSFGGGGGPLFGIEYGRRKPCRDCGKEDCECQNK